MGASLALAGLAAAASPEQDVGALRQRARVRGPGQPRSYATATLLNGYAIPVLVRTVDGRPIKVEGNPDHPLSRGATDIFAQAAVLGLYDPDRSSADTSRRPDRELGRVPARARSSGRRRSRPSAARAWRS